MDEFDSFNTPPSFPTKPSIEEQCQIIPRLMQEHKRRGLVAGKEYYLVQTAWWDTLAQCLAKQVEPPPISNSELLFEGEKLCDHITKADVIVLPAQVWDYLVTWYGGGPVVKRRALALKKFGRTKTKIELRPMKLKMIFSAAINITYKIEVSRKVTLEALLANVLKERNLRAENIRLWMFDGRHKTKFLYKHHKELYTVGVGDGSKLLVETKLSHGSWPSIFTKYVRNKTKDVELEYVPPKPETVSFGQKLVAIGMGRGPRAAADSWNKPFGGYSNNKAKSTFNEDIPMSTFNDKPSKYEHPKHTFRHEPAMDDYTHRSRFSFDEEPNKMHQSAPQAHDFSHYWNEQDMTDRFLNSEQPPPYGEHKAAHGYPYRKPLHADHVEVQPVESAFAGYFDPDHAKSPYASQVESPSVDHFEAKPPPTLDDQPPPYESHKTTLTHSESSLYTGFYDADRSVF